VSGRISDGIIKINNRLDLNSTLAKFLTYSIILFLCACGLLVHMRLPFLSSFGPEEKLLSMQAALNYYINGILDTNSLPNYSTRIGATPFVYTHLNDLPAIIIYIFKLFNLDGAYLKGFFLCCTLIGGYQFYGAFLKVFSRHLALILTFALMLNPEIYQNFDHVHWPLTFLTYGIFLKCITLDDGKNTFKTNFIVIFLIIFSSLYSWFATIELAVFSLLLGVFITQYRYLAVRAIVALIAAVLLKVFLNASYLGLETAITEVMYTLSNRIIGKPGYEELNEYFNNNSIVLWGSARRGYGFLFQYYYQFVLKYYGYFLVPTILFLFAKVLQASRFKRIVNNEIISLKIYSSFIVGLFSWSLLFPAHSAGYASPPLNAFVATLPLASIIFFIHKNIFSVSIGYDRRSGIAVTFSVLQLFLKILFIYFLMISIKIGVSGIVNFNHLNKQVFSGPPQEILTAIEGKVVFTNISVIYIGAFAPESYVVGRCPPVAIEVRDSSRCFNTFESRSLPPVMQMLSDPDYFLFVNGYLSGNSPWTSPSDLLKFKQILLEKYDVVSDLSDVGKVNWLLFKTK
jgi:hypothetical protein